MEKYHSLMIIGLRFATRSIRVALFYADVFMDYTVKGK